VPKFSIDRFPAGFFDLSQDLSRGLPIDVIERWTRSDHSLESALKLLEPARIECAVVSTDSAGLTLMTERRGLIEMLALINRPKQLIHAFGAAVEGAAVGVWAADNTEMFYPPATAADDLLAMLLSVNDEIDGTCEVRIGAAAHWGNFFLLAGGLYGADADRVERIAEDFTRGGEIVVTPELAARLRSPASFRLAPRDDLPASLGPAFRVVEGPRALDLKPEDYDYPFPYSAQFYNDLERFAADSGNLALLQSIHERYSRRRTVVLIEREREESDVPEISVLNDLALSAAMTRLGAALLRDSGGTEIKTAGPIGIFTFPETAPTLDFARRFRRAFLDQGIQSRIGIDEGEVLVFDLESGLIDIAGMPVNLASKLAQDCGQFGRIYLTASAARAAGISPGFQPHTFQVSGVSLDAYWD
jgi:class 3 adenylate cyclase